MKDHLRPDRDRDAVINALQRHQRFLVTSHVNVDGDSLGSELAVAFLLRALKKTVMIVDDTFLPENLRFLPGIGEVRQFHEGPFDHEASIVVDVPVLERVGRTLPHLAVGKKPVINIDSHVSNVRFGTVNWVRHAAASAGELVYELYPALGVPITKDAAVALYVSILTDTGSFRYSNTTPHTHRVAAELIERGADPAQIHRDIYERRTPADLRFIGACAAAVQLSPDGKIAWLKITPPLLKSLGGKLDSADDVLDLPRSLHGVEAVFVIRGLEEPGAIRVSLRSRGRVDVNAVAKQFGGGGHAAASGCTIRGTLEDAEHQLLERLQAAVKAL